MLRNYLKVALKVFWRHKFFTAVNLFGICFTLVVLMVAAAFVDQQVGPIPPEVHAGRTLHLGWLFVERGTGDETFRSIHKPSYAFLDRYVRPLETAENVAVFSDHKYRGLHGGAEEGFATVVATDAAYWEVFRFDFRQGRPYSGQEVEAGELVAVIRAGFSRRFFGSEAVTGRSVPIDGRSYRVLGVVADPSSMRDIYADLWVPMSTDPTGVWRTYKLDGKFNAAVLARRPADVGRIRAELAAVLAQVEPPPGEDRALRGVAAPLLSTLEEWARSNQQGRRGWADAYKEGDPQQAAAAQLRWWLLTLAGCALLFMLLPALHLVNLNMGRIEERTSEIGVRKSFGASTRILVGQFVAENVLLTLVGAAVSLPISWGILSLLALHAPLHLDAGVLARTFLYGLLLALFFGAASGAWPAWKMARLHPVRALTGRES